MATLKKNQLNGSRPQSQAPAAVNTNFSYPSVSSSHQRAASVQLQPPTIGHLPRHVASQEDLNRPLPAAPGNHPRPTTSGNQLQPPPAFDVSTRTLPGTSLRNVSAPSPPPAQEFLHPHAQTLPIPRLTPPSSSPSNGRNRRKSWFGGGSKLTKPRHEKAPRAWIAGGDHSNPYNLTPLVTAQMVPELWNENGDTFVYLFPRDSGKGPSFRLDSTIFSSSATLTKLAFGNLYSIPAALQTNAAVAQDAAQRRLVSAEGRPISMVIPGTPTPIGSTTASYTDGSEDSQDSRGLSDVEPGPVNLYLPLRLSTDSVITATKSDVPQVNDDDIETLVQARNLFAFLLGQSLVATETRSSFYSIFMGTSDLLRSYGFSNLDGSTYGEVAHASFESFVEELQLADVRASDEKTIDMLVLSERMKSVALFNEAFVHAVGKWQDLQDNPRLQLVSSVTINRLEKAAMDLDGRKLNVKAKLEDFDFPGLFAGLWISNTADEAKAVRFSKWKDSYNSTKNWFRGYYKQKYGAWPPKASSKKNDFEVGGFCNRLVLKDLYHDLSCIYDLLVDRTSLTTRSQDVDLPDNETTDVMVRALRKVLGEYDRSTPPVQPPIPFDTPLKPKLMPEPHASAQSIAKAMSKKLKKEELHRVLELSYNKDSLIKTHFVDSFLEYNLKQMDGATITQMAEIRFGQWVFFYAVLQSLPMLVVDAPGIAWTDKVEYFLCIPPRQGVPWAREDPSANRSWYGVAGSDKVVYLPSDLIHYGVEGVFRNSHGWEMAAKWTEHSGILAAAAAETLHAPLPSPPDPTVMLSLPPRSRSASPPGSTVASRRQSMVMLANLEALPVPAGVSPIAATGGADVRHTSAATDPSKTFDAILGSIGQEKGKKKKK